LPEFIAGVKELSSGRPQAKYSENRVFLPQRGPIGRYEARYFHGLRRQIRYLADQSNINRILALNNEFGRRNNRKTMAMPAGRENRRIWSPEEQMSAIIIRNLSPETHRALKARTARHGLSSEAEARSILDDAVRAKERVKLGSGLLAFGRSVGGLDLDISRDPTRAMPVDLE
jgi:plasmid stability protein